MRIPIDLEADRLLFEVQVSGHPRPHDFTMELRGGKFVPKPNPDLWAWEDAIAVACSKARGSYARPHAGPVFVVEEITIRPRNGEPYGAPATTPIKQNGRKTDARMPDVDNLAKAIHDGLAKNGAALANDVVIAGFMARKVFGPNPGVKLSVYAM